jgi:hypothetical protein
MKPLINTRPGRTNVTVLAAVATVVAVITLSGAGTSSLPTELPRSLGRPNPEGTSI